jgi:hypothetical protein
LSITNNEIGFKTAVKHRETEEAKKRTISSKPQADFLEGKWKLKRKNQKTRKSLATENSS